MDLVRPFAGLRPAPGWAAEIAAPPYDVVTVGQVREILARNPHSFLRVSRADACLPDDRSPYSDEVYETAARHFAEMLRSGQLVRESGEIYYAYRMTTGDRVQTGVVALVSGEAYADGRVRRHELTRPDKELDRVRQIDAVNAVTGPVMLVSRANRQLADVLTRSTVEDPVAVAPDVNGTRHELWIVSGEDEIMAISEAVNGMESLYIADGHHRSAAGHRVFESRRAAGTASEPAREGFPGVVFPADEVRILGYHRLVRDLGGYDPDRFLSVLGESFEIRRADRAIRPSAPESFGMYLDGRWFDLQPKERRNTGGSVADLAVSRLTAMILQPVLGLGDPRTDSRIDFVGGETGPESVAERVDSGEMAVGFTVCPMTVDELMAVADKGRFLPPKTTWFEPKLADGLISFPLD